MTCPYYKTLIFSHRGRCKLLGSRMDNSLGAIERLKKIGVRGVEIDLWLLKDNETAIFHDNLFSYNGGRKETDLATIREIESVKTSQLPPGQKSRRWARWRKPPTVEEVINSFPDMFFNFELKFSHLAGLNEREKLWLKYLLSLVEITSALDRVIFSSFNWDAVDFIVSLSPTVRGGYLFEKNLWHEAVDRALEHNIFSLHPHFSLVTPSSLEKNRRANLKTIPWTVNDKEKMKEFFLFGLDGIITDYPSLAVKVRDELCREFTKS